MVMLKDFATWYKTVDVADSADRLEKRWSGVEAIVSEANLAVVTTLLAIAQGWNHLANETDVAHVRAQFTEADPYFDQSNNDAEMRVLSEAALVQIIEQPGDTSLHADAVLFLAAALCGQGLAGGGVANLSDRVASVLKTLAEAVRSRIDIAYKNRPKLQLKLDEALDTLTNPADINQVKPFLAVLKSEIESGLQAAVAGARKDSNTLRKQLRFQDEELDMLWWASNQHSTTRGVSFEKLKDGERALVAGEELARLTLFKPGPLSAASLLAKAGVKSGKKISIPDAVNACERGWLKTATQDFVPTVFQPIHLAIIKKLETMDDASWIAAWLSMTGLPAQHEIVETELARLFYLERLVFDCTGCD